ncbi:hypothetical protein HanIR_Chr14g0703991 [Helianthus annuus]|nr:hypothetical protein HanIR_Chr14g0703991 [Helianthus annuus]
MNTTPYYEHQRSVIYISRIELYDLYRTTFSNKSTTLSNETNHIPVERMYGHMTRMARHINETYSPSFVIMGGFDGVRGGPPHKVHNFKGHAI